MTDIRLRLPNFTASLYLAPSRGITAWRGKHSSWRCGFVVRVLWLGIVVRWGRHRKLHFDYGGSYFELDEEPH